MPPALDIYGLTRHRDYETINRFINDFVDRAASEDRGDEELMMDPLDGSADDSLDSNDWEPAISLTHIIERGLSEPPRAFAIWLEAKRTGFGGAVICFTSDNQLILSVYIPTDWESEDVERAKVILEEIAIKYDCHLGLVTEELPPPRSEKEFREAANHNYTEFYKEFKG